MMKFQKTWMALAASAFILGGCLSDDNAALSLGDVFVLTSNGQLATFNRTDPSVVRTSVPITGVMSGDTLLGMDFRPRDGQLYAVARTSPSNAGRLYTINTSTGVATAVATLTAAVGSMYNSIDGAATSFGVDFNPAADALRVISNTGQNLRIVMNAGGGNVLGSTFLDGNLARTDASATPFADTATAYTNSFDGTTSTRMFNLDITNGNLIQQTNPNGGATAVAAPLFGSATAITGTTGFDIDASNNRGFALLTVGSSTIFYSIAIPDSTATLPVAGPAATAVGAINIQGVVGMTLALETAPQAVALDGDTAGSQRLLRFGIRTPNMATASTITGLPSGERLLSIDFRPSNGRLYGLSNAGKIFTINPDTGAATLGSTLSVATEIVNGVAAGKNYAIDFNPVADALRIVSSGDGDNVSKNYRVPGANLESTGATTTDTDLTLSGSGTGFGIAQIAYTNSFANPQPTSTRMFNIDADNNRLLQQNPPNNGTQTVIGSTGQTFNDYGGFDVSGGDNGMRLIAGRNGTTGAFSLFNIDLSTGGVSAAAVASGTNEIGSGSVVSTDVRALSVRF